MAAARDPIHELRKRLRSLHFDVGSPTYQRLARCAALVGIRLPTSTASDLLHGSRLTRWSTVEAFVRACEQHVRVNRVFVGPNTFDLGSWRGDYERATRASAVANTAPVPDHTGNGPAGLVVAARRHSAFLDAATYFTPLLRSNLVFHHRAVLMGRAEQRAQLVAGLEESGGSRVVVVSGPGGIGKSRLVLEVLQTAVSRRPQRRAVVHIDSGRLHADDFTELEPGPIIVLVEDAYRDMSGLHAVLEYAQRNAGTHVLVTCRPLWTDAVRQAVLRARFDSDEFDVVELTPLELAQARELVRYLAAAEEMTLPDDVGEALATLGQDCPLIPVVAVSMAANGSLTSPHLRLDVGFRQQILDRFADVTHGGLPGVPADEAAALISAFAALAPVSLADDELLDAIGDFVESSRPVLLARLEALGEAGVLIDRDGDVRVVPDVLGDASLTRAAVRAGRDTGYVQRLWKSFRSIAPVDLGLNLIELDWQVRSTGGGPDLLATIWPDMMTVLRCHTGDPWKLLGLLSAVVSIQPERVVDFVATLVADGFHTTVPDTEDGPDENVRETIRGELALIAGLGAAKSVAARAQALDVLWELARTAPRWMHTHGLRPVDVVNRFAQYTPGFDTSHQAALVEAATRWLREPARTDDGVTPFDLLEPIMTTHVLLEGDNTPLTIYRVPLEEVCDLRTKVRALAVEHGTGPDVRRACTAVQLIRVVSPWELVIHNVIPIAPAKELPPVPGILDGIGPHHFDGPQAVRRRDDDEAAFNALASIARGTTEPLVRLWAREAVSWLVCGPDPQLASAASALVSELDLKESDLVTAEIYGRYPELVPRGSPLLTEHRYPPEPRLRFTTTSQQARERHHAAAALWASHEQPAAVAHYLNERLRVVETVPPYGGRASPFICALARTRPGEKARLADAIRSLDDSPLVEYVHLLLR